MAQGILLIDKPKNKTSFYLILLLRRLTGIQKIGHAGTLDPLATGVMVLLVGKEYTRLSEKLIKHDKEYQTKLLLGKGTDTYDTDGQVVKTSDYVPTLSQIELALAGFQGTVLQIPPMYSAKKVNGKKLYDIARAGDEVERTPKEVTIVTELLSYQYPTLDLKITCSSGTYVRTIAEDLGNLLGCYACVSELTRVRSGPYHLSECNTIESFTPTNYTSYLRR